MHIWILYFFNAISILNKRRPLPNVNVGCINYGSKPLVSSSSTIISCKMTRTVKMFESTNLSHWLKGFCTIANRLCKALKFCSTSFRTTSCCCTYCLHFSPSGLFIIHWIFTSKGTCHPPICSTLSTDPIHLKPKMIIYTTQKISNQRRTFQNI